MRTSSTIRSFAFKQRIARPLTLAASVVRAVQTACWPILDLIVRLSLAQIFLVSGLLKAADWDNALHLAANEYPVTWLDPTAAAWIGVFIELGGAALLAAGLCTRVAAAAMLALTLVIQFNYLAFDAHLFWAAFLLFYVVHGAGPVSLDRSLTRGLAHSALPFAEFSLRAGSRITRSFSAPYFATLRLWLAAAMAVAAIPEMGATMSASPLDDALPIRTAGHFPAPVLLAAALFIATGLATALAAALSFVLLVGMQTMDPRLAQDWWWLLAFGLLAFHGAGALSADALIAAILQRAFPQLDGRPSFALDGLPHVAIVGAGFGGLACAAKLARAPVRVTLIDRHNYHLFQPLLYQVATAGLSPGDIATPIRSLFRERFNARVLMGEVTAIDPERRELTMSGSRIQYDYLVLATGASHSYFGRDEWAAYAPGLKRVEDATQVRRRMLTAFELAEAADDEASRQTLLTFVIVGAGPTGVELAGAIAELARHGMEREFRNFDPALARVVLVQAGPRILPALPAALSEKAQRALERLGVEILLNSRVERIDDDGVLVNGERIASRTVLWAAGVVASPAAKWLRTAADNAGRLKVGCDLSVPGWDNVFAIGDTALSTGWNGQPVPGLAPAAKQGGLYVARVIRARVEGRLLPGPFRYRHLGSLATIGRKAAVADFGWLKVWGTPAWWLWGAVHIGFLVGMRNRVSVMFDWFWAYLTYRSGTRLITGGVSAPVTEQRPIEVKAAA